MLKFKPIDNLRKRLTLRKISGSKNSKQAEQYCMELFQLAQRWDRKYKQSFIRKFEAEQFYNLIAGKLDSFPQLALFVKWNSAYKGFFSDQILQQIIDSLVSQTEVFPRSLLTCSDKEAYNAPVRGIGSPNGVHVTMYKAPGIPYPVQLAFAGCTGDQELNSRIFSALYALAIASDSEPTLITTNGGIVTVLPIAKREDTGNLLKFVLGPTGPVEPSRGIPSLGINAGEAMMLVGDFLREAQGSTGLIQLHEWHFSNSFNFETELRKAFTNSHPGTQQFRNPDNIKSNTGVIYSLPVFYKYSGTDIRPISVHIPYTLLDLKQFTEQVVLVRREHMALLQDACQKRVSYARDALNSENRQYEYWKKLVDQHQDAEFCRANPIVYIQGEYNFELGVTVAIDPPREVERRDFEENHRPRNIEAAQESLERYEALSEKLCVIDSENGKADILTTKYLVDSIIRRAPLLTHDNMIRQGYERLLGPTSLLLWTPIIAKAKELGFDPSVFAADNVVFNATLKDDGLVIEPYYLVDINNFVAEVTGERGVIRIAPANRESKLQEALIPDPENRITDLNSLNKCFTRWMDETYNYKLDTPHEIGNLAEATGVIGQPALHAEIWIQFGKHCILNQNTDKAAKVFAEVLRYDFASVYYWNAVFNQYIYFEQLKVFKHAQPSFDKLNNSEKFLVNKLKIMQNRFEELKKIVSSGSATEDEENEYAQLSSAGPVPLSKKVNELLQQLASKDLELSQHQQFSFIRQLIAGQDSDVLRDEEFHLSPSDKKKKDNFFNAIGAIELLNLAVFIHNSTQAITYAKKSPYEVRQLLEKIIIEMMNLAFARPFCGNEIINLYNKFENASGTVDIMGVSFIKSQLFALSELVADESYQRALSAAEACPNDSYNVVIPSIILTHWKRSYASVLDYVLKIRGNDKVRLGDFNLTDLSAGCSATHGIITAEADDQTIVLKLNREPVALLNELPDENLTQILDFFSYGIRLGLPNSAGSTVLERIQDMEILSTQSILAESFYRNKEVLAVLLARKGFASIRKINLFESQSEISEYRDIYGLERGFVNLQELSFKMVVHHSPENTGYFEANIPAF